MSTGTIDPHGEMPGQRHAELSRMGCLAAGDTAARLRPWQRQSGGIGKIKSDYYKVLSLEHSAAVGAEEIKRAFRRLALWCHPDLCPPSLRERVHGEPQHHSTPNADNNVVAKGRINI
ncbi:chaperone protein dnaJ 20, chloroplastic-like [Panicum miliaceum]|uniref:Chaperone protein dnaJ 20, chloroplastic-like n=1 Tax=Panicum miliaceum TaxID=4540 RepID=A0A3L6QLG7_PANMI|nr:chaperone protein dnaJ 20, chloroplastic-like [Panicum miliaceum]